MATGNPTRASCNSTPPTPLDDAVDLWSLAHAPGIFGRRASHGGTMGTTDPRMDAYIAKSPDFARPILEYLREVVHEGCPDAEETMKWSMPHFTHHGILCGMAAFKKHCAFGFWKGSLVMEEEKKPGMGHLGAIESLADLPPRRKLVGYVKKAAKLNEEGIPAKRAPARARKPLPVPDDLAAALERSKSARATFEGFAPSHRREYIEWITEAKTAATREKRLVTTIEWLEEGKGRHWKYQKK